MEDEEELLKRAMEESMQPNPIFPEAKNKESEHK